MMVIIFYSTDAASAKLRARQYNAEKHHARVYDASVWTGSNDKCDAVDIMPDVPSWQIDRIMKVYSDRVLSNATDEPVADEPVADEPVADAEPVKTIVNRGGGKWFVMMGDEELSGPHSRTEARALAQG